MNNSKNFNYFLTKNINGIKMNSSMKYYFFLGLAGIIFMVMICISLPKPELIISILIRISAFVISIYFVFKYQEWRIIFLSAMFLLMAVRQVLTFLLWTGVLEKSELSRTMSEVPGFAVTILSLLSVIYIGLALSGKIRLIQEQQTSISTLKELLPICSNCKKIRDDKGYWKEIESYIEKHTDSKFSHGICEKCYEKLYGEDE